MEGDKMEQTSGKDRMKELTWSFPNIGKKYPEHREEAENFCREYKTFLDNGKTERETESLTRSRSTCLSRWFL